MSHFEFAIPVQRDDLRSSAAGEYEVTEVLQFDKLEEEIEACVEAFASEGCTYILDHFDTLYSVLIHFSRIEWSMLSRIFDNIILRSLRQLIHMIEPLVEDSAPDSDTRIRTLNILKMNLYIFTQFHTCTHDKISFENSTTVTDKVKGKRGKKSKMEEFGWDWDEVQRLAFIDLYQILKLPISKLWDPPIPEEQFINMCANCCYKTLEHPTITHVKSKPLRETVFQVLGVLLKRYNHGISCVVKIVQLLTLYEHVVSPLAHGVVKFVRELGFKSLINEIVRELMATTESTQDNASVRSFSNFLVEVAELEPEIMIPTTKELTKYLDQDPYSMRCCVLSVMTEILLNQLSHETLEEVAKNQRDLYLDLLEEHTCDVNAFVRSRVLQLWQKIVHNNAVPKSRFLMVVSLANERVLDKSSNVCKHAIGLLKTVLEQNPYSLKLDTQQLINQLLISEEKILNLEQKVGTFKDMTRESIWQMIQQDVIEFLKSALDSEVSDEPDELDKSHLKLMMTKDNLQENMTTIAILLSNRKFGPAFQLLKLTEQSFPGVKDLKSDMPENNTIDYYVTLLKEIFMMYKLPEETKNEVKPEERNSDKMECDENCGENPTEVLECGQLLLSNAEDELNVQRTLVEYLMGCLGFTRKIEEAITNITMILNEESITEVLEAVNFLKVAYQFGVPSAEKGVQEMLRLVFRKEVAVKDAVNSAYNELYLTVRDETAKRERAIEEVNRLSKLALSLDFGQLEALTHLIVGWIKNKEIDEEFINVLWDRVKSSSIDKSKKQTALVLLSMVTQELPHLAKNNLNTLISEGLEGCSGETEDIFTVIFTCGVIFNITKCKEPSGEALRFPSDNHMFSLLVEVIEKGFSKLEGSEVFLRLAQEAINVIIELSLDPTTVCESLLVKLYCLLMEMSSPSDPKGDKHDDSDNSKILDESKCENPDESKYANPDQLASSANETVSTNPEDTNIENEDEMNKDTKTKEKIKVSSDLLLRFIYVIGYIAFKYSQYLENYYLEYLKKEKRAQFKALSPTKKKNEVRQSMKKRQTKGEEEIITENDLLAAADDTANEEVRHLLDSGTLYGDGLLAAFSNLILNVCKNPKKYRDPLLKCVAATALTHGMMVSSVFCAENMQLLVTMLEKSPEESVRQSLVIAFGDLLFKFPNTVEPWTRFLYARLRDESWKVRRSTLLVLSHLVTNEMVKVKGQISEVALCIVDENEEISELAKRFFSELSQKGNTLYNVLPDIISHLSNPDSGVTVEEKDFEIILRFIMDQIQKEKQLENLVEKLCKRMKESLCERQWKDLAFCLSLLPWSDRSLRRLIDYAGCFCDRLLYQPVATLFLSIVSSVTKSTKPGLKEIGAELNTIIDDVLTKGSADHIKNPDDLEDNDLPLKTPKNPRKTPAKTTGKKTTVRKKKVNKYGSISEEDSDDSDYERKKTTVRKKKIQYVSESEEEISNVSESEDEQEKEVFQNARKVPGRTRRKLL